MCECEWCREAWSAEAEIEVAEGVACEFSTEATPDMCGEPATYQLVERYVDDHFCEEHAQERAQMLGEGLMNTFQQTGVSDGETLQPITTEARCSFQLLQQPLRQCGKPAKYANVTMTTTYFCGQHRGWAA